MSYCRFGDDSDVYLYEHIDDFYECCSCRLMKKEIHSTGLIPDFKMHKSKKMLNLNEVLFHLMKHKKKEHKVPDYALERVLDELGA